MEEFKKEKEAAKKEEPKKEEKVEEVTIDDFAKLQFKVGTIVKCEPHPKADRLLVEQIDLGGEVRQIVSGIAKHYKPEELIGKQVVVVTNLKPVKLRVFKQLQLAGLGIVVFVFGLLYQEKAISIVGICILIFGLLRTYYIKKVIDKLDE